MSLSVIFLSSALADIQDAYRWYEERQASLGSSFMVELGKVEELISTNPEMFGKVRGEVRRAVLHRFPYGIFYIVRPNFVSIIAVLHHARNPEVWQARK